MQAVTIVYLFHKERNESIKFYSKLNIEMMKNYIEKVLVEHIEFNVYLTNDCHPDLSFSINRKILRHFKINVVKYEYRSMVKNLMYDKHYDRLLSDKDEKFLERNSYIFNSGITDEFIEK